MVTRLRRQYSNTGKKQEVLKEWQTAGYRERNMYLRVELTLSTNQLVIRAGRRDLKMTLMEISNLSSDDK